LHIEYVFEVSRRKLSGENFNGVRKKTYVFQIFCYFQKNKNVFMFFKKGIIYFLNKIFAQYFLISFSLGAFT
jgi:hypothetical protein